MARLFIDKLEFNTTVLLRFHGSNFNETYEEEHIFRGVSGEGDDRRALFWSATGHYDWEAYRYRGHWAYGTSADRLSLVAVVPDGERAAV